jgi:hypothetical protein
LAAIPRLTINRAVKATTVACVFREFDKRITAAIRILRSK